MKKCSYCGAEHPDDAVVCRIDQTPFPNQSARENPAVPTGPRRPTWLRPILRYVIPIFLIPLLYLLSLGPVSRYGGVAVYERTTITTNSISNGAEIVRTTRIEVKYPHWISVVYYPAFKLRSASRDAGIYGAYIDWWGLPSASSPASTSI